MRQIARAIDQPGHFFLAEYDRQTPWCFRIRNILTQVRPLQRTDKKETYGRHALLDGVSGQLPVAQQVDLVLPDVFWPELVRWSMEVLRGS